MEENGNNHLDRKIDRQFGKEWEKRCLLTEHNEADTVIVRA